MPEVVVNGHELNRLAGVAMGYNITDEGDASIGLNGVGMFERSVGDHKWWLLYYGPNSSKVGCWNPANNVGDAIKLVNYLLSESKILACDLTLSIDWATCSIRRNYGGFTQGIAANNPAYAMTTACLRTLGVNVDNV